MSASLTAAQLLGAEPMGRLIAAEPVGRLIAAEPVGRLIAAEPVGRLIAAAPTGKAGPVGLFVVVLLGVASYFLFRSMSRHLKRVPAAFDDDPRPEPPTAGARPPEPRDSCG